MDIFISPDWEQRLAILRDSVRGDRWSQHFSRSQLGANVFTCRLGWLGRFLTEEGHPYATKTLIMGPTHEAVGFADGGWFARRQSYSIGGFGALNGEWLVGFGALRYVCSALELTAPRLLKGEQALPDSDKLAREVWRQMVEEAPAMEHRAQLLLTPETANQHIPNAVFYLLGAQQRPRFGLGEKDTALVLDTLSWEFLQRVMP